MASSQHAGGKTFSVRSNVRWKELQLVLNDTLETLVLLAGLTILVVLIATIVGGPTGTLIGVTVGLGLVGAGHSAPSPITGVNGGPAALQPALATRGGASS